MNLLIAIMGDTFARVQEGAIVEFYHNFAELIYELEVLMPEKELRNPHYFPPYMFFSAKALDGTEGDDDSDGVDEDHRDSLIHGLREELKAVKRAALTQADLTREVDRVVQTLGPDSPTVDRTTAANPGDAPVVCV